MSYNDQIRLVLNEIKNGTVSNEPLSGMSQEDHFAIIEDCYELGYITTGMKSVIFRYMGGADIADDIRLKKKGHDFLEGKSDDPTPIPTIGQQFNVQSAHGSYFGNNGTINNRFGITFDELLEFIKQDIPETDQPEATELVETVQANQANLEPGMLKRFDSLLEKYPNLSSNVGKVIMAMLAGVS